MFYVFVLMGWCDFFGSKIIILLEKCEKHDERIWNVKNKIKG